MTTVSKRGWFHGKNAHANPTDLMLLQPATHGFLKQRRKSWILPHSVFYSFKTMKNNVRKIVLTNTSPLSLKQGKTVMDKPSKLDHLPDITPPLSTPLCSLDKKRNKTSCGSTSFSLFLPPEAMSPSNDVHDIE